MADPIERAETTINLVIMLAILGVVGFGLYEVWKVFGGPADNGKPRCSSSDMSDGNCVSGDGSKACSWWEFLTATSCYKGTPPAPPASPSLGSDASTALSAAESYYTASNPPSPVGAPGLPAGYDPSTGMIDGGLGDETSQIPTGAFTTGDGGGE